MESCHPGIRTGPADRGHRQGEAADRQGPRGEAAISGDGNNNVHTRTWGVGELTRV